MSKAKKKATKKKKKPAAAAKKSAPKKKTAAATGNSKAPAKKKQITKSKAATKKPSTTKAAAAKKKKPRAKGEVRYWLMKSEPNAYSITDLAHDGRDEWDGVRNYQARNFMRDEMAVGDEVLFYHSNANPSGIAGRARVSREAAADLTALDPESKYFDPKATQDEPRWYCVEVEHVYTFPRVIPLSELKESKGLEQMEVLKRGQRLSIMPVTKKEFQVVCRLATKEPTA